MRHERVVIGRLTLRLCGILTACYLTGCEGGPPAYEEQVESNTSRVIAPTSEVKRLDTGETLTHRRPHLMDAQGRYVHIKGLNVSGSHKAPPSELHGPHPSPEPNTPEGERHRPSRYPIVDESREECLTETPIPAGCLEEGPDGEPCTESDTCTVNYIGSPFPIDQADRWFGQMAEQGFNSVRLITNWESIQPYRPGSERCMRDDRYTKECYDLEYLDYYEELLKASKRHGIYVLVDMHQDIFSRHIMTLYNESPSYEHMGLVHEAERGTIDHLVLSLFPPYTDWVRGHGAPRWVVQTALPEKKMGSEYWGMFRGLGGLVTRQGTINIDVLTSLQGLLDRFNPNGELPPWLDDIFMKLPERRFAPNETSDILPLTPWIVSGLLSLDVDRGFAALFAGDEAFPDLVVDQDGLTKRRAEANQADAPNLKEYLQGHYIGAYKVLAERAKKYDHVIGYDVINEPVGAFLMMAIGGLFRQLVEPPRTCEQPVSCLLPAGCEIGEAGWPECVPADLIEDGETPEEAVQRLIPTATNAFECIDERGRSEGDPLVKETRCRSLRERPVTENPLIKYGDQLETLVVDMLGEELGGDIYAVIRGLQLLPFDAHPYTMYQWGLSDVDVGTAIGMNLGFEEKYLQPFFEEVGRAIQEVDPNAIIWFEPATSLRMLTGAMQFWDMPLARPRGINQLVFAPHWYPDIYPNLGINSPPRAFNVDEWLYRDFTEPLREHMEESPGWLGNIPVVFGEFGTYFNLQVDGEERDPELSADMGATVLNSYYEAFEELGVGSMLWCFSATNDAKYGEDWNHEDFSIIGPDGEPRGEGSYVRTYARSTSGKLVSQHFTSPLHFWDPQIGKKPPFGHYDLHMERKESLNPTVIYVPDLQYPDGFYVWLSDGNAYFDFERQLLYWYPSREGADVTHDLHIEPRVSDYEAQGWSYYFNNDQTLVGASDATLNGQRGL